MSHFQMAAIDPRDGEVKPCDWLDNYFGKHRYGVRFPDGRVFPADEVRTPKQDPFYPSEISEEKPDTRPWVTRQQILDAHAEFGRVDYEMTKEAMGPNWPREWDKLRPGQFIFEPKRKE